MVTFVADPEVPAAGPGGRDGQAEEPGRHGERAHRQARQAAEHTGAQHQGRVKGEIISQIKLRLSVKPIKLF